MDTCTLRSLGHEDTDQSHISHRGLFMCKNGNQRSHTTLSRGTDHVHQICLGVLESLQCFTKIGACNSLYLMTIGTNIHYRSNRCTLYLACSHIE